MKDERDVVRWKRGRYSRRVESSYNTPKSDRGKFYKFVSRTLNIGHAKEEVFLMNEQSGISHVKILPSSLFKHLL